MLLRHPLTGDKTIFHVSNTTHISPSIINKHINSKAFQLDRQIRSNIFFGGDNIILVK